MMQQARGHHRFEKHRHSLDGQCLATVEALTLQSHRCAWIGSMLSIFETQVCQVLILRFLAQEVVIYR